MIPKTELKQNRNRYRKTTKDWNPRNPPSPNISSYWEEENYMLQNFPKQISGAITKSTEMKSIVKWVRPPSWGAHFRGNYDIQKIKNITSKAFLRGKSAADRIYELCDIYGVGPTTATAILMFWRPDEYTVMTKPALLTLERYGLWNHSIEAKASNYDDYLDKCRRHERKYGMNLRDVDRGLVAMGSSKF
jgi:hypothetical protein